MFKTAPRSIDSPRPGLPRWLATASAALLAACAPAFAQEAPQDAPVVQAREALRKGDTTRLLELHRQLLQASHPLAPWVDYWELSRRLPQATPDEVERFYERWSGSYVEDRLRNDWLLELGRRRDWVALTRDVKRFRMNDDPEVRCYALLADVLSGDDMRRQALQAWHEQRAADDGCHLLAQHLRDAAQVETAEFWLRLRRMTEEGRRSAALQAAELIGAPARKHLEQLWARPTRFLARLSSVERALREPLGVLAVMRVAAQDPADAASELQAPWARHLRAEWAAAAWGAIARQASLDQRPEAPEWGDRALELSGRAPANRGLSDETLAWIARAQLRATGSSAHAWSRVATTIDAMSEAEQTEPTWTYWKARALLARARSGSAGEAALAEAQTLLRRVASPLHFYGQLALEQLGTAWVLPPAAASPDASEKGFASTHAGLQRALRLMAIGLRSEGVREWNFSLIGMDDRQLLAAAELACDRGVWDRCIRASERTIREIELRQRYPLAFFDEVATASNRLALDAAWVLGVIRQESRFVTQARSRVGAAGLMQVMPATARWTAKRIGLDLKGDWRDDHVTNLRLGTSYLRMVLDDFDGSLPMALAAYNAGPNRARRWRETATLEPAIWTETIPIRETRDYVKKVLSNAAVYARLIGGAPPPPLKSLLGPTIGPRASDAPAPNKELP